MKNLIVYSFSALLFMASCVKDAPLAPATTSVVEKEKLMETVKVSGASFSSSAHPTSGKVEIVEDKNDKTKKYLSFTDFKTDAGPDLRVYLAEDTKAKGFTEVARLSKTGSFLLEIPAGAKLDKQKFVLIWCEDFSVLFGSAKFE
jgi:Electron transfer DM13